jgi:hypothetical protein
MFGILASRRVQAAEGKLQSVLQLTPLLKKNNVAVLLSVYCYVKFGSLGLRVHFFPERLNYGG